APEPGTPCKAEKWTLKQVQGDEQGKYRIGGRSTAHPTSISREPLLPIDLAKIRAIDVHVHAEVSCHDPEDPVMGEFFDAASAYFKAPRERPKMPETIALYREAQIALVLFTVDAESAMGAKRVSNYEVAEQAAKNDDICIAFASIDPHKGKYGAREARDLVENYGVKGFKFHGIAQNAHPADRMAYPIYEVIAEYGMPAI